jgi:hypothetical protein
MIFPVILWSVAKDYFDMITYDLSNGFKVSSAKDYMFDNNYEEFIRKVYEPDSIADWKITKKLDRLQAYPKIARLIQIEIPDPAYRVKSDGNTISTVTEQIKKVIRHKYAFVKDHLDKPDTIIHMGDTHEHSKFITDIFAQYGLAKITKLDLPRFLSMIEADRYALTKIDTPYMVDNFPHDYPAGKDLDILVHPDSYNAVMVKLINFSRDYHDTFEIRDVAEKDGIRIRFHNKFGERSLNYQIDITSSSIVSEKTCKRNNGYKVLMEEWECYSRLISLKNKPHKAHHIDFITPRLHMIDNVVLAQLDLLSIYKTIFDS